MRVIAGKARSLPLKTVPGKDVVRPTTDRIKETLFNILAPDIADCRFLDLFAGSGAIGIEALSRGAQKACFVEKSQKAVECIKENLRFTRLEQNAQIVERDVLTALRILEAQGDEFDIIFMDPPYGRLLEKDALSFLSRSSLVARDAILVVEASRATSFSYLEEYSFHLDREKIYGSNKHVFISKED